MTALTSRSVAAAPSATVMLRRRSCQPCGDADGQHGGIQDKVSGFRTQSVQAADRRREIALWADGDCSELLEMPIEGKRTRDPQVFDEEFARAVGEAPILVGKTLEYSPCFDHIGFTQVMHARDLAGEKPPPHRYRAPAFATRTEQRQRFIHYNSRS